MDRYGVTLPTQQVSTLSAQDLRQLASLADLRDSRRANNLQALLRGPTLGAFAADAPSLPPTSPEELGSAMQALALRGWSTRGLVHAAEGYSAGRLPPETVDRVVVEVLRRRERGEL
jgi:hypothetical protein